MTLRRLASSLVAVVLFAAALAAPAQSRIVFPEPGAGSTELPATSEPIEPPTGFGLISLGLEIDEVKELLESDPSFLYRGDPDVSMLALPNDSLIETKGVTFVERGYFQFHEQRLYTIILELDPSRVDHYAMYTTFVARYGEPAYLSPAESVWEFEGVRLSLERPLRVKYIDTAVFDRLVAEQGRLESLERYSRDAFLDQF